ncbi:MAG: hypothetical protein M3P51_12505 [Chloroflexota bacterium]|nr:hypothetical protein [Chloroflexota bacterium]
MWVPATARRPNNKFARYKRSAISPSTLGFGKSVAMSIVWLESSVTWRKEDADDADGMVACMLTRPHYPFLEG